MAELSDASSASSSLPAQQHGWGPRQAPLVVAAPPSVAPPSVAPPSAPSPPAAVAPVAFTPTPPTSVAMHLQAVEWLLQSGPPQAAPTIGSGGAPHTPPDHAPLAPPPNPSAAAQHSLLWRHALFTEFDHLIGWLQPTAAALSRRQAIFRWVAALVSKQLGASSTHPSPPPIHHAHPTHLPGSFTLFAVGRRRRRKGGGTWLVFLSDSNCTPGKTAMKLAWRSLPLFSCFSPFFFCCWWSRRRQTPADRVIRAAHVSAGWGLGRDGVLGGRPGGVLVHEGQ